MSNKIEINYKMEKVESFELDHRKVKAPYIRKCCVQTGKLGDKVCKFDVRFLQPNRKVSAQQHFMVLSTFLPMSCAMIWME
jgi:LuxS protein involved in autoinducer AI2 synthesis